ncbi:BACON domain-containing protein [uncultured Odoribacter sp.]|uniref:BACON domain-containing protein n=1 Tax=uncultured Odoribacter sp. TaxID=876416 RepID=UPI0026142CDD|nr:BACON domain-containing protein [uncultured Odoribacter sp.]
MKKLFNLLMIALCVFATACSDDDDPKPVPLSVNPTELTFAVEGGSQEVTLSLAGAIASPDKDWCTAVVTESKAKITVTANEETQIRTAKVTFTVGEQNVNVTVTQSGKEVVAEELTPEKTEVNFEAAGGEEAVKVTATAAFTAESSETWLTATAAADKVTLKAAANTGEARSAKVTLKMGEKMAEITVNQAAPKVITYEDYLGTWTVTSSMLEQGDYTIVVSQKVAGESYTVTGWGKSVVATDPKYAFTMQYVASQHAIAIYTEQSLGTYTDANDITYPVHLTGVIPYNGAYSYVTTTSPSACMAGILNGNKVEWVGQEVSIGTAGTKYTYAGFCYFIENADGDYLNFKVDWPFAGNPVMTKVSTNSASVKAAVNGNQVSKSAVEAIAE